MDDVGRLFCCFVWLFTFYTIVSCCLLYIGYFKQVHVSGQVIHTIPNLNGSVTGIAVLNDRMYVCHSGNQQIAVYNPATYQFQQYLDSYCSSCGCQSQVIHCYSCSMPRNYDYKEHDEYEYDGNGSVPQNIVGCDIHICLYVSAHDGYSGGRICKVAFGQNNMLSFWPVDSSPRGLSLTSSHNLLVVLSNPNVLQEYSTDGRAIRKIGLHYAGITNPVHCVQLSNDQFAVTHHSRTGHQFSIVSSGGQLVQNYLGEQGDIHTPQTTGVRQIGLEPARKSNPLHCVQMLDQGSRYRSRRQQFPLVVCDTQLRQSYMYQADGSLLQGMAVDEQGRIFVADQNKNQILVISSKNLSAYRFPLSADCKLNGPSSIHLDPASSRLYIGEWNAGRIICCKL